MTSFGFQTCVPSLTKFYRLDSAKIRSAILLGSLLSFVIYLLWLVACMGNLPRIAFLQIVADGGNMGILLKALTSAVANDTLAHTLGLFANFAVISSFLGVSLGLFDYIADALNFDDSYLGRFKTALVCFVPPCVGGLVFPNGYIVATGFAGLALAVVALIIPPLMVKKSREKYDNIPHQTWGGNKMIYFTILMGMIYAICHVLAMIDWLPIYGKG